MVATDLLHRMSSRFSLFLTFPIIHLLNRSVTTSRPTLPLHLMWPVHYLPGPVHPAPEMFQGLATTIYRPHFSIKHLSIQGSALKPSPIILHLMPMAVMGRSRISSSHSFQNLILQTIHPQN